MMDATKLGPYEHIFDEDCHQCAICEWTMPANLPAGTRYGRGKRVFCGEAERHKTLPLYTGLVEKPPFVVEESIHAGWIDWSEENAPLCLR